MPGLGLFSCPVAAVLLAALAVPVSAKTHHVVPGDAHFDANSWLSSRIFTVGDKLWLKDEEGGGVVVEVASAAELESCDVANPIRMYSDYVPLERAGIRFFTSGDVNRCRSGLRLPVSVQPLPYEPYPPAKYYDPPPQLKPYPVEPPPQYYEPPPYYPPTPKPSAGSRVMGRAVLVIVLCCLYIVLAI